MRDKVDGVAKAAMINVLKMYAGPSATDEISVAWNLLFVGMECCGVVGPLVSHVEFENTKWISGSSSIPYSCCKEATMSNYATGTNIQCEEMSANIYRKTGCFDAIYSWFSQYTTPAIVVAVFILAIEIIAVIFAIVLFRGIKEEEEDRIV